MDTAFSDWSFSYYKFIEISESLKMHTVMMLYTQFPYLQVQSTADGKYTGKIACVVNWTFFLVIIL
jgi:hypothetical protein